MIYDTGKRLIRILEQQIIETDSRSSEVGTQRERNHRYYAMQPLGNEMPGRSRFVSSDVMDVVESKKSLFKETFFSGRRQVMFLPGDYETAQQADAKTAYAERQLKNSDWYRVFRDGIHDAFVAKRMVLHVEWLDDNDVVFLDADGADQAHLAWQLQQIPDIVDVDISETYESEFGQMSGRIRVITDAGRINIKLIQPERYYRDPLATYPEDSTFVSYEEDETRGELVSQGYDPEQVSKLQKDYRFRREEEDNARRAHDGSWSRQRLYNRVEESETVTTYWTYARLNLGEYIDGMPEDYRLWKIRWCHGEVLHYADGTPAIEEAAEMPFLEWSQYKISHAEQSRCDADVVSGIQHAKSVLQRLVLDNQQIVNTSRLLVQPGAVKNLRALKDTRIGGVIEAPNPAGVVPLPAPQLSPAVMPTLEMLESDKEARSGNNRLAKGMNKDAISQQNASDMIERITNAANRRTMMECRDFAETLYSDLLKMIYRLGVRHDKRLYKMEVGGQFVQVSPQQWQEPAPECHVQVALTSEHGVKQAMQLMQMHQMINMDPQLQQLYGVQQRHALMDDIFDLMGVTDSSRYLMMPGSPEHQMVMQQQQQQMMMQQQMAMQQQQLQAQMLQSSDQREWSRLKMEEVRLQAENFDKMADNSLDEDKFEHQKVVDFAKLRIDKAKTNGQGAI